MARMVVTALALLALWPASGAAAPPGFDSLLRGRAANGASWELSAQRTSIAGLRGVCLDLTVTFADGTSPGTGGGCAAGSLRATHNVLGIGTSSKTGDTTTSSLVGRITVRRARVARVKFADGRVLKLRAKLGPRSWRRALGVKVRFFAADALHLTAARPLSVVVYDRRGRRVGRGRIG